MERQSQEACQDDRVQVEGITHFLLGKTSRISASRFSSSYGENRLSHIISSFIFWWNKDSLLLILSLYLALTGPDYYEDLGFEELCHDSYPSDISLVQETGK